MYYSSSPDVSLEYESDDAVSKLAQLRAAIKDMKLTGSTESSRFHDDGDDDNEASMFVTTGSSPQSPRRHRHISEESHLSMKSTASTESIAEVYSNLMDGKGYRTVYTPSASPILSGRSTPHRSHSRAASSSANSSPYSPMKSTISLQQPQQQTLTLDTSRLAKSSSDSFDGNDHQNDSLISPRPVAAVLNMKPFFGEETDDNDDEEYRNDGGLNDQSSPPSSLLGISFRPFSEMEDQVFKSDRSSHSSIKFPGPSPKSSSSSPPPRRRKYNKQHIRRISAPPRAIEFDFDSWAEKMGHYFPEEVQENLKRDAAIKDLPSPGQVLKQHFEKEAKILQFPLLYDTKVAHARGEWFSPDRSEFHENLINAWLGGHHESNAASSSTSSSSKYDTKTPLPGQRPFLILMGGAPGAGKSSTLSYLHHKKLINNHNYVYINTDWIRLEILEYKIWTSEEMQPPFRSEEEYDEYLEMMYIKLKREVDYITMQIYSRAISAGKNIVRDGTLRNTGFYSKLLSDPELDQRNYVKGIIHVDVKDEVARERVINRGGLVLNIIPVNDDKEVRSRIEIRGQKITESYFNESGPAQITEAIGLLKPLVDFYVRIDNNSPRFTSLRVQECSVKSSASSTHLALVQSSKRRIVRRSNIGGGRRVRSGSSENIVEKELILDHDEDSGFVPSSLVEDEAGAMNGSDSEVESILEDYDVLDVDTAEQLKKEYGIGFAPSPSFWNQKEARDAKFRKCLNKAGLMFL